MEMVSVVILRSDTRKKRALFYSALQLVWNCGVILKIAKLSLRFRLFVSAPATRMPSLPAPRGILLRPIAFAAQHVGHVSTSDRQELVRMEAASYGKVKIAQSRVRVFGKQPVLRGRERIPADTPVIDLLAFCECGHYSVRHRRFGLSLQSRRDDVLVSSWWY